MSYSKKKSVVWAEKNIIHNLDEHPNDSDSDFQRESMPAITISNFNEARGETK